MEVAAIFAEKNSLRKYLAVIFLSIIGVVIILKLWKLEFLSIPFAYRADSLFYLMSIKSIVTSGWYLTDPSIGVPDGYLMADYPMSDGLNYLLIKCFSLFTSNWALISNLFYLMTFPLTAGIALFVFRQIGLSYPLSLTASLLFTYLPYHFQRGTQHLFLSAYYMVPVAIYLSILIYQQRFSLSDKKRLLLYLFLCLLIGASGIYYAFFCCFFLLIAGLIASSYKRQLKSLFHASLLIGTICCAVIVNLLPTLIYHSRHQSNSKVAQRLQCESEMYGLKIVQLVLPINDSRITLFKKLKRSYNNHAILVNENSTASLGLIGSAGFLILLVQIFRKKQEEETSLNALSHLSLCGLLLATIGGFSSLFALVVSPSIRGYNRISVFLGFFALAAAFLILQKWIDRKRIQTKVVWQISFLLLALGIYDQTSSSFALPKKLAKIKQELKQDQNEICHIEALLPKSSLVFQLPYLPFPEGGNVHAVYDYDPFRAPLFSRHLKWSYGAMRGRATDQWQKMASESPVEQMLEQIVAMGFSGLYLNRNGYLDQGQEMQTQISALLDTPAFVSDTVLFWDLRPFALQKYQTVPQWEEKIKLTQALLKG